MNLYWVTTKDHDEDCFVIAQRKRSAEIFFEDYEGYDPGNATAEKILTIPDDLGVKKTGWIDVELLKTLGGKILHYDSPMVVEISGRKFVEGGLQAIQDTVIDDLTEKIMGERLNKTKKNDYCN